MFDPIAPISEIGCVEKIRGTPLIILRPVSPLTKVTHILKAFSRHWNMPWIIEFFQGFLKC
jgi:hypothetical protein